jgi:outer membrane immunogenic protein
MSMRVLMPGRVALFALVLAVPASAADLARPLPVKAPPPPVAFSWTGCYLGGYVGGAGAGRDAVFTDLGNSMFHAYAGGSARLADGTRVEGTHSWNVPLDSSVIAGGTLGCNWQPVGSAFVLGIEGEGGYMNLKGSAFDPLISPTLTVAAFRGTPDVQGTAQAGSWYAMATGRLGYAFDHFLAFDHVLAYVKGGAAFLPIRGSILDNCLNVAAGCGNWVIPTATSQTLTTGTIGGGLEWAFAPNWSIKAEYMFIGLGDHSITSCGTSHSGATLAVTPGGDFCFNHEFPGIHTGKIGINFHFGP